MSAMIEAYYTAPVDVHLERRAEAQISARGGKLTYREEDEARVTLTIELRGKKEAEAAMQELSLLGIHVEGPSDY
jgi:hypothetical protein